MLIFYANYLIIIIQFECFFYTSFNYHTCISLIRLIFFLASGCKSLNMSPKAAASGTVLKALRKFAA